MTVIMFTSAYRQLRPLEKQYVDGYVAHIEREAARNNERISLALYRPVTSDVIEASRGLLEKPMVVAAISERISFANVIDYMDVGEDGFMHFNFEKCTPEQLAAVKSFEIEETMRGRKVKVTMHDKMAGLNALGRYMGMLEPDNPHWRAETARPVKVPKLPGSTTDEAAADAYSRLINA
jgi:hypothetical protein